MKIEVRLPPEEELSQLKASLGAIVATNDNVFRYRDCS
jgi:hypothetical protein